MSNVISKIKEDEEWKEKYYERLAVDLKANLTKEEVELLKKFNVKINDEVYTEYQYDCVKMVLAQYYTEKDIEGNIVPPILELENIGVTEQEYDKLLKKFDEIDEKYQIYL